MVTNKNLTTAPKPFVFVLMPFAKEFDDIYTYGIKGAAEDVGAYAERIDEQMFTEGILDRIFNQISKADVIVADMTGQNPNVFYEVGYAHALGKIVLLITQNLTDIPFDLKHRPHVIYDGNIGKLRPTLVTKLLWALESDSNVHNKLNVAINLPTVGEMEVSSEVLDKLTTQKKLNIAEYFGSIDVYQNKILFIKSNGMESHKKLPVMVSKDAVDMNLIELPKQSIWGVSVDTTDKAIISAVLNEPTIQVVNLICEHGDEAIRFALAHAIESILVHKIYTSCWLTQVNQDSINGEPSEHYISRSKTVRSSWALYLDDLIDNAITSSNSDDVGDWGKAATRELVTSKLKIFNCPELTQRSITRTFVIVHDAQNLSRQQLKNLVMGVYKSSKLVLISKILPLSELSNEMSLAGVVQMTNNLAGKSEFACCIYPEDENRDGLQSLASEI